MVVKSHGPGLIEVPLIGARYRSHNPVKDLRAGCGVAFHEIKLLICELSVLIKNCVRYADLTDVMKRC